MADETAAEPALLHSVSDGVSTIVLNRPDRGNAITPAQRDQMIELFEEAGAALTTRAVVLTANGRHFCTGADLRAGRPSEDRPDDAPERPVGDAARMIARGAQRLVASVLDCEKPVLCALNGTAAGIGAHLALASDLVIAAEGAELIEVFSRRGIVPDGGGAYLLSRTLGLQKAKELVFFGDAVSADDAMALGLVNRVVPADELEAATAEWAARLASGPTKALGLAKALLNRAGDQDRAGAFADEAWAQELVLGTDDMAEGVQSFIERRDPEFKGW